MMTPRKALPIIAAAIIALASCQSTDEYDPAEPYISEGYALTGLEAADAYRRGLDEIGDSEELYYNLAYSYLEAGEYEKAIETADEALEIHPDMLRFRYLKAYAYREARMMASYERELLSILDADPGNNDIRGILALYYRDMGMDAKAKDMAMEILRRTPSDPEALSVMADYSEFYDSIDKTSDEEKLPERPWNVPPALYDPLRILHGEGLISWT